MKKIIYLLILLCIFAMGCGRDNTSDNKLTENTQGENSDKGNTSDENGEQDSSGITGNENDDTIYVEEIPFDLQIELPEGTTVGKFFSSATVDGTTGWLLENPDYTPQREYLDIQDELLFTKTACGWIENHPDDGSYSEDGGPILSSEFYVERKNGEDLKCGYFCEITLRVFSMETIREHSIQPEYRNVEYWCIVYKKEATEFTWIFLDKAFFSEEQAKAVADSLPEQVKQMRTLEGGYRVYIDPIPGYKISYNYSFSFKSHETGEVFGASREVLSGEIYQEVKESKSFYDWGVYHRASSSFFTYITGDVGMSIYVYENDVSAGQLESGDIPEDLEGYLVIWGHRKSTDIYYIYFPEYMELDEVERILQAIHFEFEEPTN